MKFNVDNILNVSILKSELEYEEASLLHGILRWLTEEIPHLKKQEEHLEALIIQYAEKNWSDSEKITDEQVRMSDMAEVIVENESLFLYERKEAIRESLIKNGLTQKELGMILGHRPNYTSELINGVRPFSKEDIVVLHRLFQIPYNILIPPFLKNDNEMRIRKVLYKLHENKPDSGIQNLVNEI